MTCKEFIALIAEYLDVELTPEVVAAMEEHLGVCGPCRAYLATYRKTRTIVAAAGRVDIPDDVRERVERFLLEHLRR